MGQIKTGRGFRHCVGGWLLAITVLAGGCTMATIRAAEDAASQGNWDAAVATYRDALKKDPFNNTIKEKLKEAKVQAAAGHYSMGHQYMESHHIAEALQEFKLALGLNPGRREHHAALADALRLVKAREELQSADKLRYLGRLDDSLAAYVRAAELDPNLTQAMDGITKVTAKQRAARMIGDSAEPVTLRFQKAKLREVFEILARTAGVNVVFDKDVRDSPVTIFLKDMPYHEALNLILSTNSLRAHRIGADTLLIAPDTKQKKAQYQDLMIRAFYLSNVKAKSVSNLLRSMLENKRVFVDEKVNVVVVRDEPAKLHLAERVIQALDRRPPEVELDLEVLEVNRTKSLEYGLNFAKQASFGIVPPGVSALSASATQFSFQQLTSLGKDSYLFTFPATVLLDFFKQESDAKTLASPRLRVLDGEKASINVGDKQPILLSTTNVNQATSAGISPSTSTVTSVEFKDTGVKLTVEPTVHLEGELTLKLKVEVTRLGDEVTLAEGITQFRFGTRTAETTLRMRDGETVVLAGLIQDDERKTRVTVPWLGDIPILGDLLSSTTTNTVSTEVVLTITPHIIHSLEMPDVEGRAFWSGTASNYATSRKFSPRLVDLITEEMNTEAPLSGEGDPTQAPKDPKDRLPLESHMEPGLQPAPGESQAEPKTEKTPAQPQLETKVQKEIVTAGGAGVLALRPSQLSANVGQQFMVHLVAQKIGPFAESVILVTYDPTQLEFLRGSEGNVLKRESGPAGASVSVSPESGKVVLHVRRPSGTVPVSGALASLMFRAKQPGVTPVTIQSATASGAGGESFRIRVERTVVRVQ